MLDDFREWLSDNLRYILLGLAVILILVIAFFAIRLVRGIGSPEKPKTETEQMSEETTEAVKQPQENKMIREAADSKIQQLVTQYYTARAAKDYDTLAAITEVFSEDEKQAVESEQAVESYENIITYSKAGLDENTYIVYVYYDAKIVGIDTLVPSLVEQYIVTNAEGNLVLGDCDSSQALQDYLLQMQEDPEVQALVKDVKNKIETAKAQDPDLAAYVEDGGTADGGEGAADAGTAQLGMMKATTDVNVRSEPSTSGQYYGGLSTGMQAEVLENLDNGWSHVRYTTNGTTIEGYVMTQYLAPVD